MKMQEWSASGFRAVPHVRWGSHLARFFGSATDLRDLVVPYFKAGLENNERCLWVTGPPLTPEAARSALRTAVPDLDRRERDAQIEIANGEEWYATNDTLRGRDLVNDLLQRERDAAELGFAGLRTNGICSWVPPQRWAEFMDYEKLVQDRVRDRRMICLCSYCLEYLPDDAPDDVMARHDLAIPSAHRLPARQRNLDGVAVGHAVDGHDETHRLRKTFEQQKRTFDLAMLASKMGTWRYTLADNICVYDENAQRLYGLTDARFLHDDEGVNAKFHPDDRELMWARVAAALDPAGDGQYDVEYRVKQLDGSWRWLSAWGLVEFEGTGADKRPVAITGASRDLTERKRAEELQRLLLNELNHRVKNTLTTIQAISAQTLRAARDLPSAREALDRRILSMAQAHDLLTVRAWSGASLADVVVRALDAFAPAQVNISGDIIDLSPKQALALSLALHELATNAAKYGALSRPEGSVNLQWRAQNGMLHLDWEESGGPPVSPPTRKGFGSRLLQELLVSDLGGDTRMEYAPSGLRCSISARLDAVAA